MSEQAGEIEGSGIEHPPPSKVKIPVKLGEHEERIIELDIGGRITAILDIIAAERGCRVEELILVRDGHGEVLTSVVVIEEVYPHKRRHHVHHAAAVAVTVYYQTRHETRDFRRAETIDDVLLWAIKVFNIDPSIASEFGLARHGQKDELPGTEHVGHVAGHHRELALDLIRGDIANGHDR